MAPNRLASLINRLALGSFAEFEGGIRQPAQVTWVGWKLVCANHDDLVGYPFVKCLP